MSVQMFEVDGMTCGHCVSAVTAEVTELAGGAQVSVVLGNDGPSTVTVTDGSPISDEQMAAALDEAGGYTLHVAAAT